MQEQRLTDNDWVPIKTGIPGGKFLKCGPKHIMDAEQNEPLYPPAENILEDCLRREAERVAQQENLVNRIVYDSVDADPSKSGEEQPQTDAYNEIAEGKSPSLPSTTNCDNDQDFPAWYQLKSDEDTTLQFESRFESANLRRALQIYDYEYDLILKPDYLTKGYCQWFYFRAQNTRAGKTYRFNIINLLKPDSLYNHGMKPLLYSEIDAHR